MLNQRYRSGKISFFFYSVISVSFIFRKKNGEIISNFFGLNVNIKEIYNYSPLLELKNKEIMSIILISFDFAFILGQKRQ